MTARAGDRLLVACGLIVWTQLGYAAALCADRPCAGAGRRLAARTPAAELARGGALQLPIVCR